MFRNLIFVCGMMNMILKKKRWIDVASGIPDAGKVEGGRFEDACI